MCEYRKVIYWPQHGGESGPLVTQRRIDWLQHSGDSNQPRVNPATLLTGRNMVERADHV
jgi:hypothetical protein